MLSDEVGDRKTKTNPLLFAETKLPLSNAVLVTPGGLRTGSGGRQQTGQSRGRAGSVLTWGSSCDRVYQARTIHLCARWETCPRQQNAVTEVMMLL